LSTTAYGTFLQNDKTIRTIDYFRATHFIRYLLYPQYLGFISLGVTQYLELIAHADFESVYEQPLIREQVYVKWVVHDGIPDTQLLLVQLLALKLEREITVCQVELVDDLILTCVVEDRSEIIQGNHYKLRIGNNRDLVCLECVPDIFERRIPRFQSHIHERFIPWVLSFQIICPGPIDVSIIEYHDNI